MKLRRSPAVTQVCLSIIKRCILSLRPRLIGLIWILWGLRSLRASTPRLTHNVVTKLLHLIAALSFLLGSSCEPTPVPHCSLRSFDPNPSGGSAWSEALMLPGPGKRDSGPMGFRVRPPPPHLNISDIRSVRIVPMECKPKVCPPSLTSPSRTSVWKYFLDRSCVCNDHPYT